MDDRQRRIPGFSQDALGGLVLGVVGAGGLGGEFVRNAVRKGVGRLIIYDGDDVSMSNLNRQFFTPRDLGKNKAIRLAGNASRAGYMGSELVGVPYHFQTAHDKGLVQACHIVFCGVDNDETRVYVARYYRHRPVIFTAVGPDAGQGYVAVQEPGKACFGCMRPQTREPDPEPGRDGGPCPANPAAIDILSALGGPAAYAVDSLVMSRPRTWNYKQIVLHGRFRDINADMARRTECPTCGGARRIAAPRVESR